MKIRNIIFKIKLILFTYCLMLTAGFVKAQNCTVNAGIPETICANQNMQLNGNSVGLFNVTASWSQVGGPSVNITNLTDLNSPVTGYTGGEAYTFRISATCQDGISVYDEVTITVNPVTQAYAGTNQESCPGGLVLNANASGTGETGLWSIQSNGAGLSALTLSSPSSSVILPQTSGGTSILRWTISHTNGCNSYDEVVITNYGGISPVSAGSDQTLGNCYATTQSTNLSGSFGGNNDGGQQGTWSLVSGPSYPTIADINSMSTNVSNLVEGVYVFRWAVSGPCVNGSDKVTISVPAATQSVTNAGAADLRFCYGATTAVLNGSVPQYANEVVNWTQLAGPAGPIITNPNNATTSITGLDGSSTYRFGYTITNTTTGCSDQANRVYIRYTSAPTIDIGTDQVLNCGENSATISPITTGGTNTRYKIISGPFTSPGWTENNNANVIIGGLNDEGTYTIQFERYSVGAACTSAFDNVNITVSIPPTLSNAGTDQNLACNVVQTDLAGNAPSEGVGTWSQVTGPNSANIVDILNRSSHIDNLIEGKYTFRWVIAGGNNCPAEQDEVVVTVATSIPAIAAGSDRSVCHSSEVILEGNTPGGNATGSWTVSPGTGITFSDTTDPNASVFGMLPNTAYTFTWAISNQCQVESDQVVLSTGSVAGPSYADAGPDQCENNGTITLNMNGNNPTNGTGLWTILEGPNSPTITNNTLYNSTITGMVDGHYLIEWSINVPSCTSTRDTLYASIVTGVTQSNAGADESVCGSSVVLSANSPATNETGRWEQVSGNSGYTISDVTAFNASFSNLWPGRYEFSWIIEKGICPSSSDTLVITVTEQPDASITAANYTLCSGTTTTIAANNPNSGTGVWSVNGAASNLPNIASISSPTTTVSSLVTGVYNFRWTITTGADCNAEIDDLTIQVSAPAVADPDQTLCNATETFLEGTIGSSGTWSTAPSSTGSPLSTIINTTSQHTANVSGMGLDEIYTFRYTVDATYGCPSTVDSLTVSTSPYGSNPDAGPDQEICTSGGNSITMAANIPGIGTGSWSQLSGPNTANIVNTTLNNTQINNLVAGIYVFEWNIDYGYCGNYKDVVKVTVNEPPTPSSAGPDQNNACQLNAQLTGNLPTTGVGTWTLVSAPTAHASTTIIINNPSLPASKITNIPEIGAYTFRWTTTNGTVCATSSTDVVITFTADPPTTPGAGIDQNLCDATSVAMAGNNPAVGSGSWSQISGPAGASITSSNTNNTSISNLSFGTYEFRWEIVSGGCILSDNMFVINSLTPPTADASGTDTEICQFNSPQLIGNNPGPGTGSWSFVSGPSNPIISSPDNSTSNVTGTSAGAYTFKWTVSNGACPATNDNVTVTIVNNPITNLTVSGNEVCAGANATVTIQSTENLVNYELFIGGSLVGTGTGNGGNIDIAILSTELSVGNNYVDITTTNSTNCSVNLDNQALIKVNSKPDQSNPVSDDQVCENENAVITIGSSQIGVNYEAFRGAVSVGTGSGNGGNLDITMTTDASWVTTTTISITATSLATSCVSNLTNQAIVTVNANPLTNRTVSGDTICLGSNGTVNVQLSETGVNYEAFVGAVSVGTGSGNGSDLDIAINASELVLGDNTIDIVATNATSSCSVVLSNQATVVAVPPPLPDRTVAGNTVCENVDGTVSINSSENGVTYNLFLGATLVGTGSGTGGDITINVNASNLSIGANTIAITATNTGCTQNLANQATINVNAKPVANLAITGSTLCDNINGTVTISSSESGINYEAFIGANSVDIATGDGNDLEMTILASNLTLGSNTVQIVATNTSTSCFVAMSTPAVVTVNVNPDQTVQATGNTVCDETDGTLTIQSSESGINYEAFIGSTSVGYAFGNGNDLEVAISSSDLTIGNNIIDVIAGTSANCIDNLNDQAIVIVNANPVSNLKISNSEICNGDTSVIVINNSEQNIKYELFIDDELVGGGTGTGSVLGVNIPYDLYSVGTNQVAIKATNTSTSCSVDMGDQAEILVEQCKIVVYDGFSPNGDGINETFIIEGLINYPDHKVMIFNRWGNKVYEASPYLNDWDGTSMYGVTMGGNKLPVGTYFYIIEPGKGEKAIKGYIYLNK